MALQLLNYPSLQAQVGLVTGIVNYKGPGGQSSRWGIDQVGEIWQGSRQYQNKLLVTTSSPLVGSVAIQLAVQAYSNVLLGNYYVFPLAELSAYDILGATEQDTGSFAQSVATEQVEEDGKQWIVTIDYGPFDIQHELGTSYIMYGSFTPLDFPPVVKWSTAKYHRSYPTDCLGYPFINTAGDPLENPPQREESTQSLRLILWNSTYDEPFAQSFRDTMNQDTFLGFAPTYVKCKDIDGERIYTADYGYVWRIVYDFEIRQIAIIIPTNATVPEAGQTFTYGWQEPVLNLGYRAFGGATGAVGPIAPIVIGQVPITSPVILNQNGTYTTPANVAAVQAQQGNQQLFLIFSNFPYSTFANLNIDQNILTENQ